MKYERLVEILTEAKKIHKASLSKIDFTTNNKKQAIYIIQGGILTSVSSAFKFNLAGYHIPASQQKRLIDEAIDLIWFFDENEEQERQLNAWFDGHVVERTPGNSGNLSTKERAGKNFLTEELIEQIDDLQKKLKNITSTSMHPTIKAMRATMRKSSHTFDYDNEIQKKPPYSPVDFGNMFITPAIYSLLIPVKNLPVSLQDFDYLRSLIKEVEKSTT